MVVGNLEAMVWDMGVFGPEVRPMLGPALDRLQCHHGNDRHYGLLVAARNYLRNIPQRLTNRETRHLLLNGPPVHPIARQRLLYRSLPYLPRYLNKFLLPSLINPINYEHLFGFDPRTFYQFREDYIIPAMLHHRKKPHSGTADAMAALFLMKLKHDITVSVLLEMFGLRSKATVKKWFYFLLEWVYMNSPIIQRMQNLSNPQVKLDIMNELVCATLLDEKFSAVYSGWVQRYNNSNPNQVPKRLTCVSYDSKVIKTPSSLSFDHQKRTFTTRINKNGMLKLVGAALDGTQKYIYVTTASISPAHTDESLSSSILHFEANSGVTGGLEDMLKGHDDELRINLGDRGFKDFFPVGPNRLSFRAWCRMIELETNGRVIFRFPLDPGDDWFDRYQVPHPPPVKPPHLAHVNLMQEVMVNSSRLFNLSHR